MLPAAHRMRRRNDFTHTVRRGRRAGGEYVVVHLVTPDTADASAPVIVGFVVSKAVGPSVTRKLVARRLRHLMADRLTDCPPGSQVVVRALPASAAADYATLGAALDTGLRRCLRSVSAPAPAGESA